MFKYLWQRRIDTAFFSKLGKEKKDASKTQKVKRIGLRFKKKKTFSADNIKAILLQNCTSFQRLTGFSFHIIDKNFYLKNIKADSEDCIKLPVHSFAKE